MNWIAVRMLMGSPGKFLSIVLGIAFATLLIGQQSSIFCGLIRLTASQIRDLRGASIWVMDPNVQFVDDIKPMTDGRLERVRGVPGVAWAVPLYKGLSRARLENGNFQQVIMLGLDDATMIGMPSEIVVGQVEGLARPDAVFMDERGARRMWPDDPFRLGREFEMNDRRAVLVGICQASRTFQTFPIIYCRYSQALRFAPPERKVLSFILADAVPGQDVHVLCDRIREQTGLKAETREQFIWSTIGYYLSNTGIPINFGITVLLGFFVGTAVAGQTFYLFTVENLRQFGTLKALGTANHVIVRMVMLQALIAGILGFCFGIGGAALFGEVVRGSANLAFYMPWQVIALAAITVILIVVLSSLLCILKVLALEPAVVFKT